MFVNCNQSLYPQGSGVVALWYTNSLSGRGSKRKFSCYPNLKGFELNYVINQKLEKDIAALVVINYPQPAFFFKKWESSSDKNLDACFCMQLTW